MTVEQTTKYRCDRCGKEPGRPYGPLILSFGVDPDLFEGALEDLPTTKHFCDWRCAAAWVGAFAEEPQPKASARRR